MAREHREINIFVAHSFKPLNDAYDLNAFRKSVLALIDNVRASLTKRFFELTLRPIVEMVEFTERLPTQIGRQLDSCHFGLIDISDNNPNVLYELGYLAARGVPRIVFKWKKSEYPIPADISTELIFMYDDISEIEASLVENMSQSFGLLLENPSLPPEYLRRIWFERDVPYLHVICSPELEKSSFAHRSSPNYIFLDNLEDKDALVEILKFLSRYFQRAKIVRYASDNLPREILEGDLIVIGGPGEPDGPGNIICREMMLTINSSISYSDDAEVMYSGGLEHRASLDKDGYMVQDYGYFARFPNPLNPTATVVLANGIHTYGTLGSTLAFSDHPSAQVNIRKVMAEIHRTNAKEPGFECFFEVNVLPGGGVACPQLAEDSIFILGR